MTEVSFYHLTETALDAALPTLVDKAHARQWRTVIQVPDEASCAHVDALLWEYEPVSFLPHGRDGDDPEAQPVYVTAGHANPNGGTVRFVLGGARPPDDLNGYDRVAIMFDGNDDQTVSATRDQWRQLKTAGHRLAYFRQTPDGRWEKAA